MEQRRGDRIRSPKGRASGMNRADRNGEALSLSGDSGKTVAENVARIALGTLTVAELRDPRYKLAPDGTLSLELDRESFDAVRAIVQR
jgi:hypothetical protein